MRVKRGAWLAALAVGLGMAWPPLASAEWGAAAHSRDGGDCPQSSYSPCHFWAPAWYRMQAYHHCCHPQYLYAADRYPEVPPTSQFSKYPCRAVDPATYYGLTNNQR